MQQSRCRRWVPPLLVALCDCWAGCAGVGRKPRCSLAVLLPAFDDGSKLLPCLQALHRNVYLLEAGKEADAGLLARYVRRCALP